MIVGFDQKARNCIKVGKIRYAKRVQISAFNQLKKRSELHSENRVISSRLRKRILLPLLAFEIVERRSEFAPIDVHERLYMHVSLALGRRKLNLDRNSVWVLWPRKIAFDRQKSAQAKMGRESICDFLLDLRPFHASFRSVAIDGSFTKVRARSYSSSFSSSHFTASG